MQCAENVRLGVRMHAFLYLDPSAMNPGKSYKKKEKSSAFINRMQIIKVKLGDSFLVPPLFGSLQPFVLLISQCAACGRGQTN